MAIDLEKPFQGVSPGATGFRPSCDNAVTRLRIQLHPLHQFGLFAGDCEKLAELERNS